MIESERAGGRGWALAAAAVVIVAVGAVAFVLLADDEDPGSATASEKSATDPGDLEGDVAPRIAEDHWHSAYAIWVCDRFIEPLRDLNVLDGGIHTHHDGLIHIHPISESSAGANAVLGRFATEVGVGFGESSFSLPSGETYETGDDCEGTDGVVRVLEWLPGADPGDAIVHDGDFETVPLDEDGKAYTIAFMRSDTRLGDLHPPSAEAVEAPDPLLDGLDGPGRPIDALPPPLPTTTLALPEFSDDAEVRYQPVLAEVRPGAERGPGEWLAGRDGTFFSTGPPLPSGLIESAQAVERFGTWEVDVVFNEGRPGIDDLNDIAPDCIEMSERCPTGRVALVIEGLVISAPSINSPSFDRDAIRISGGFTEEEARNIAAVMG